MKKELALFFTRGVSLKLWDKIGILERELAIYKKYTENEWKVNLYTYGGRKDLVYSNRWNDIKVYPFISRIGKVRGFKKEFNSLFLGLNKIDVIKTNQIDGADVAVWCKQRYKKPLIIRCGWIPSVSAREAKDKESYEYFRNYEKDMFPKADSIIVTSKTQKEYVVSEYGIDDERVHIIPNYVDTALFSPDNGSKKERAVITVGRLSGEKNIKLLIDAVSKIQASLVEDIKLYIIGNGELKQELEEYARLKNVRAIFLGTIKHSELPGHLNKASVFVLPSLYEGHPKTLIEAMSCGMPVIGTNVVGINEVIKDGENGILVEKDAEELKEQILYLLNNSEDARRLGNNARQFAVENYSLDKIFRMERELVESLK